MRDDNRKKILALLERVPDYKAGYVAAYLEGITAGEEQDDAFCRQLMEDYQNDPDPEKDTGYPLSE